MEDNFLPECPRCRYCLHGQIAGWSNCCPVHGRCTECGIDFEWKMIFSGASFPDWSVESPGRPFRSFVGTSLRLVFAPLYWRGMRLEHPLRWRRIAIFTLIWFFAALLSPMIERAAHYGVLRLVHNNATNWVHSGQLLQDFIVDGAVTHTSAQLPGKQGVVFGYKMVSTPRPPWAESRSISGFRVGRIPHTEPFDRMFGVYFLAVQLCSALTFVVLPITRRRARVARRHFIRAIAGAIVMMSIVQVFFATSSFGRAIIRVLDETQYFATTTATATLTPFGNRQRGMILETLISLQTSTDGFKYGTAIALLGLWTIAYWYCVCRLYFRMDRAVMVAASVVSIGVLLPVSVSWIQFVLM